MREVTRRDLDAGAPPRWAGCPKPRIIDPNRPAAATKPNPMLDITLLRRPGGVVARPKRARTRSPSWTWARFNALESERKTIQTRTEDLQARRNLSKQIGQMKGRGEDTTALMVEVSGIGDEMKAGAERLDALQAELQQMLMGPEPAARQRAGGADETANVEVRRWGTPALAFP